MAPGAARTRRPPAPKADALSDHRPTPARSRHHQEPTAAVVESRTGDCSTTELPEHTVSRAGIEPATRRLRRDNRSRSGPQQHYDVAVMSCSRMRGIEPHDPKVALTHR